MQMAQGFGVLFMVIWFIFLFGSIAAAVFFILAAWRAMRAHESIAGSMKVIAEALQVKAEAAVKSTENKENA